MNNCVCPLVVVFSPRPSPQIWTATAALKTVRCTRILPAQVKSNQLYSKLSFQNSHHGKLQEQTKKLRTPTLLHLSSGSTLKLNVDSDPN